MKSLDQIKKEMCGHLTLKEAFFDDVVKALTEIDVEGAKKLIIVRHTYPGISISEVCEDELVGAIGKDYQNPERYVELVPVAAQIEKLKAENESLQSLVGIEFNACKTGDCPHEKQTECDAELAKIDNRHGFVPFVAHGNGFSKQFIKPIKVIDFRAVQIVNDKLTAAEKEIVEWRDRQRHEVDANKVINERFKEEKSRADLAEKKLGKADKIIKQLHPDDFNWEGSEDLIEEVCEYLGLDPVCDSCGLRNCPLNEGGYCLDCVEEESQLEKLGGKND